MDSEYFTCPYCKRHPSHEAYNEREDKELIDSKFMGMDGTSSVYLNTNMVYSVKICRDCWESQRKRKRFREVALWSWLGAGLLTIIYALISKYIPESIHSYTVYVFYLFLAYWIVGLIALPLIYLLWCLFSRTRMHVKFSRAKDCNAIVPRTNQFSGL